MSFTKIKCHIKLPGLKSEELRSFHHL